MIDNLHLIILMTINQFKFSTIPFLMEKSNCQLSIVFVVLNCPQAASASKPRE